MGLFLSTFVNKVDKKGRVSIPAPFRSTLAEGRTNAPIDVVIYPSLTHQALDACPLSYLEKLSDALDNDALPAEYRDLIDTTVFGRSVQLTLDPEGRVILPDTLLEYAGITENISFVGLRKIFQLWDPTAFDAHEKATRDKARANNISLPTILAKANSLAKGA